MIRAQLRRASSGTCPRCRPTTPSRPTPTRRSSRTLYEAGASFDVASHARVHAGPREHQATCRPRSGRTSSGTRSSTPIRSRPTRRCEALDQYKPLVTYDNLEEIAQDPQARAARRPGPAAARAEHRARWSSCRRSSARPGRGGRPDRGRPRRRAGRRGAQLPRRQPVHQLRELRAGAATWRRRVFQRGGRPRLRAQDPRHRRRLSRPLRPPRQAVQARWPSGSTPRSTGSSPRTSRSSPSRAASWWPPPPRSVAEVIGKAVRDGKTLLLHRRRRLPHLLRHHLRPLPVPPQGVQEGADARSAPSSARPATRWTPSRCPRSCPTSSSATCVYSENIGAYASASSTWFNGFPPAKVVHVNEG